MPIEIPTREQIEQGLKDTGTFDEVDVSAHYFNTNLLGYECKVRKGESWALQKIAASTMRKYIKANPGASLVEPLCKRLEYIMSKMVEDYVRVPADPDWQKVIKP